MSETITPRRDDLLRTRLRLAEQVEPVTFVAAEPAQSTAAAVRRRADTLPSLAADITAIHLRDPEIAQQLDQIRLATEGGVPREQVSVPIARGSEVSDQVLFEDPRDAARTFLLPRYRLATHTVSGRQEYRIVLEERDGQHRLALALEAYPAPELGTAAQGAQHLPHDVAVLLRYQLAGSGGAQKELAFNEVTRADDGIQAALVVASIGERDELFRALTTEAYQTQLVVRRAVRVAVPVTPPDGTAARGAELTARRAGRIAAPEQPSSAAGLRRMARIPIGDEEGPNGDQEVPPPRMSREPPLAMPQLVLKGSEQYEAGGQPWTRYKLGVSNWADFDDALFAASPDLPPCGLNRNASRTWVSIVAPDGRPIYGFCALGAARNLDNLWFAVASGAAPPASVTVTLNDRRTGRSVTSNPVALAAPERYSEVATALDSVSSPFVFSSVLHAYIFRNIVAAPAPGAGLIRWQLRRGDMFHSYYQEQARPNLFYYLPDSFKLARRPDPGRPPWMVVRLATSDGFQTESSTVVTLSYAAAPFVDADRLAAAVGELAAHVPASAGQPLRLEPLMTDAVRFIVERPRAVGAVTEERSTAAVALRSAIHDTLTMNLPDFYPLFAAMTEPSATLFHGKVVVQVTGWPAEEIPFAGRMDDMVGELLFSASVPDQASGGLRVTLTNAVESPLAIEALSAVLSRGSSVAQADIRDLALPTELAPGASISFVVAPREALAGEGELRALLDLDAVRPLTDPAAIWSAVVDETSSEYFRTVTVKAVPALFEPLPERPDEQIVSIVVSFERGDTVELTAAALEGSARIDLPIDALIARDGTADTYSYRLTAIRKNAAQTPSAPPPRRDRMFYVDVVK